MVKKTAGQVSTSLTQRPSTSNVKENSLRPLVGATHRSPAIFGSIIFIRPFFVMFSDDPRSDRLRFFLSGGLQSFCNHHQGASKIHLGYLTPNRRFCGLIFIVVLGNKSVVIDPPIGEFFHRRMGSFSWIFLFHNTQKHSY